MLHSPVKCDLVGGTGTRTSPHGAGCHTVSEGCRRYWGEEGWDPLHLGWAGRLHVSSGFQRTSEGPKGCRWVEMGRVCLRRSISNSRGKRARVCRRAGGSCWDMAGCRLCVCMCGFVCTRVYTCGAWWWGDRRG